MMQMSSSGSFYVRMLVEHTWAVLMQCFEATAALTAWLTCIDDLQAWYILPQNPCADEKSREGSGSFEQRCL